MQNIVVYTFTENDLRKKIITMEQEHMKLKIENASLKAANSQQNKKVRKENFIDCRVTYKIIRICYRFLH